jgi:5-methylcytosine-specific restriction endonuclease McrA
VKKEKLCPLCKTSKPTSFFVDASGKQNTKGKYCFDCLKEQQSMAQAKQLKEEQSYILRLKRAYGEDWIMHAFPHQFQTILFTERDSCPYCGMKLKKDSSHLDHMDPLELGGEDSIRNAVYCCVSCNARKGAKPFLSWLNELAPAQRKLSRTIYIEKHNQSPEEFVPGSPTTRTSDGCIDDVLLFEDDYLEDRQ